MTGPTETLVAQNLQDCKKSKILPKMQNTSAITLSFTQPSVAVFRYSTSAADTNGKQKINTDWNKHLYEIYWLQGLNQYYTLQCKKRSNCHGIPVTVSDMNTVQKYKRQNI